ncbi:MAG: SDR family oxidoreductase [Pedobacter sp.]|nr:MAG: SDR family oxidoreductase [Pedobacter sp.]
MERRFENQVAIISGGADGLGKGIADRIAVEGGHVVLLDIDAGRLEKTKAALHSKGLKVSVYLADISNEMEVKQVVEDVMQHLGSVDIMVNSAGIVGPTNTSIIDYDVSEFDKIYAINLRGAFLMTKYAIKAMERKGYGRVLLIASIAGKEGNPFMVGYSSMKAGVIGLVKSIGKEYATSGITVNGLAPALIKTRMNDNTSAEQLAYMTSKIPMNRLGTIEEVAAISTWIVSKESSFSTGFVFDASGGRATY